MRFNVEQLAEWWQKWLCDSSAFAIHVRIDNEITAYCILRAILYEDKL